MVRMFGSKPWTWRVEGSAVNSRTDRDVNNVIAAGGTPYLVL